MIRLVNMSGKWYGVEVGEFLDDTEVKNIETFANEGSPVLLCYDLELAAEFVDIADIEMVE